MGIPLLAVVESNCRSSGYMHTAHDWDSVKQEGTVWSAFRLGCPGVSEGSVGLFNTYVNYVESFL